MDYNEKIIDFDKFCKTCKHRDVIEYEDPCNECLDCPARLNSQRPLNYKEDEELTKKEKE